MKVWWRYSLALFIYLKMLLVFWEDPLCLWLDLEKNLMINESRFLELSLVFLRTWLPKCLLGFFCVSHKFWHHASVFVKVPQSLRELKKSLQNRLNMGPHSSDALAHFCGDLEKFCPILLIRKCDFSLIL